jgi:hypothetical protein
MAGARVDQTRGDFAGEDPIETGLVAADAGIDLIRPPALRFERNSLSARKGRAIDTMSASPRARIASATAGSLIRLVVTSGIDTAPFSLRVTQQRAARYRGDGGNARLVPADAGIDNRPAASIAFASSVTSASVLPPLTRSSIDRR